MAMQQAMDCLEPSRGDGRSFAWASWSSWAGYEAQRSLPIQSEALDEAIWVDQLVTMMVQTDLRRCVKRA